MGMCGTVSFIQEGFEMAGKLVNAGSVLTCTQVLLHLAQGRVLC